MSTEEYGPRQRAAATKRKQTITKTVSAAALLFDAHGWHGVTVEDIAKEAGVSVPAISRYFPTKQIVALAAHGTMMMSVVERAEAVNQTAGSALRNFVYNLAEAAVQHPVLAIALLPASRDLARTDDESRSASDEVNVIYFDDLTGVLGRLLERYRGDDGLTEVAELYLAGLLFWVLKHPDRSSEEAANLCLSQFL